MSIFNESSDSKLATRKSNIVKDQSNASYDVTNGITYNTDVLKFNLCNYKDAYILVRGYITAIVPPATKVAFKNCPPVTQCTTKPGGTTIDDAEYLDLFMAMYNLLEYNLNYSDTRGSLSSYSKDEATDFNADVTKSYAFKFFKYKAKILENTLA